MLGTGIIYFLQLYNSLMESLHLDAVALVPVNYLFVYISCNVIVTGKSTCIATK